MHSILLGQTTKLTKIEKAFYSARIERLKSLNRVDCYWCENVIAKDLIKWSINIFANRDRKLSLENEMQRKWFGFSEIFEALESYNLENNGWLKLAICHVCHEKYEAELMKKIEEKKQKETAYEKEYREHRIENLHDGYVITLLQAGGVSREQINANAEIIELTRLSIKTKRLLKQKIIMQ